MIRARPAKPFFSIDSSARIEAFRARTR